MAAVGSPYVIRQPRDYGVENSFTLMGNERFLGTWALKEDNCECTGSFYTTLTDTRLLLRYASTSCCSCCCQPGHQDTSIFLRDIAHIRESTETQDCCTRLCLKCCGCCTCCACCKRCCGAEKRIEIRGAFGMEIIRVSKSDILKVQNEIPAAIGNHKLVSQY